jgi:hypothetical protein
MTARSFVPAATFARTVADETAVIAVGSEFGFSVPTPTCRQCFFAES